MLPIVPPELTERTLALCHPKDVAAYAQTCRRAYTLVYQSSDQYLWQTLFLDYPFDDPRPPSTTTATSDISSQNVDWRTKLQRRVRAESIARHDDADGEDHCEFVEVLLECIREAAPRVPAREPSPSRPSHNVAWVTNLLTLKESPWIAKCLRLAPLAELPSRGESGEPLTPDIEQLRSLLSLSLDCGVGTEVPEELRLLRRMSRAYSYDLRHYVKEEDYGPFTHGCERVNWTHVNAMITVMTMNLRDFGVHWPNEFKPQAIVQGLEACRPFSAPGLLKRTPRDWAGVEGQWMRIVSFCDYRDLISACSAHKTTLTLLEGFNISGCDSSFFDDEYQEPSRLLRLSLRVVSVESDPKVLETLPDPSRPPITFGGTMRGFNSDDVLNRAIRGNVQVMKDGNIRWSYVAIYNRHDQWSSEGVQIGGACSAAGIVGAWCGAQHEQGDPSGPFWLFRAEDHRERNQTAKIGNWRK